METPFEGIVEVVETGRRSANVYLDNGYMLLAVSVTTRLYRSEVPWVRKDFTYVLGRTRDVPHFDLPPREPRFADASPAAPTPAEAPEVPAGDADPA